MTITVYTFVNEDGTEDTYTTQEPLVAKARGSRYDQLVIANEYEWSDSEPAWDFRPKSENEEENEE